MSDKSEPSKYIGYSMRKKQWVSIKPKDKRIDTYEFFDSGATAFTYVNPASNKLVKIIHGPRYKPDDDYAEFITECEKEIEYQYRAAKNGLGPHIYRRQSGFISKENSFYSTPYFYIVMEYLSEENGWEHIFIGDKPDNIFCDYIKDFVSKTGLINVKDPQAHFYYNDTKDKDKLYMIDYGNFEECGKRSISKCIILMNSALGIKCNKDQTTMQTEGKKSITKTSNGAKYNSGGKKTHKLKKNLRKSKTHKKRKTRRGRK